MNINLIASNNIEYDNDDITPNRDGGLPEDTMDYDKQTEDITELQKRLPF